MSTPLPAISVLMPVHNSERFVREAIQSILAQTFTDFELVVIDDGSTDTSLHIIQSFSDRRIVRLRNEANLGLPATLNRGISVARGQYIARNDADDLSQPRRLQDQFEFLETHPDTGLLGTAIQVIDSSGKAHRPGLFPTQNSVLQWRLLFSNPFAHSSVMYRRDLVRQLGGYRPMVGEDHDLWLRISRQTSLANLPQKLIRLRRYPGTLTTLRLETGKISAAASSRERVQEIIGHDIAPAVVEALWGRQIANPAVVLEAAHLVVELLDQPLFSVADKNERKMIEQDAARRIFKLQVQRCLPWRMRVSLLRQAVRLDPYLPLRMASNRVMIALNHPLYG
jgi:glycosyltransferase involved in cell wall biosynthesis